MGVVPGLKAFIAAVFGGIGIIPGAMIGGYFIGAVEVMVSGYGGSMFRGCGGVWHPDTHPHN